ncbi:MAG TPA: hypothetical protein VMY76_13920 [Gemmatimonadales bacterium]|nr:hypothetical protein [Gemmatimonadales bacterium]
MAIIRYAVVLLTGIIAGSRAVEAVQAWRDWNRFTSSDPSTAQAYRNFFLLDAGAAAVSLCIAALVWWLLRPRTAPARLP